MFMSILTSIKSKLDPLTVAEVEDLAASTGVPAKTLFKIKYGETDDPRIGTLQPLIQHFGLCPQCESAGVSSDS